MPQPNKPFLRSDEYRWQLDPQNPRRFKGPVLAKLKDFLTWKRENPRAPFGGSDTQFVSKAPLGGKLPGIAHLTQDLAIVYRIQSGVMYLYGIYSHNDLGTGNASKNKTMDQMATRFSNMNFSE
jgi:hypothetical protein